MAKKCSKPEIIERPFAFPELSRYCNCILLGNWYEENLDYKRQIHKHTTTYRTDYAFAPKSGDRADYNENRNRGEGLDNQMVFDRDDSKYLENFTTVYDLSYGPNKLLGDPLDGFGNLTNYGLVAAKKYKWDEDVPDPRRTTVSVYNTDYVPHEVAGIIRQPEYIVDRNPVIWETKVQCAHARK